MTLSFGCNVIFREELVDNLTCGVQDRLCYSFSENRDSFRGSRRSKFSMIGDRGASGDNKVVSITDAACINGVTRQAIYVAIKQKKLKAVKKLAKWTIHTDDLEEYRKHRYSRSKSLYKGKLLFDNARGFYSVGQTAKLLNVPSQRIYYATRVGHLAAGRRRASWVIYIGDVERYRKEYLANSRLKKLMVG